MIDRLYRIRLLRDLGTTQGEVDPDGTDLLALTRRHLADVDDRQAALARQRERVRSVEARLIAGDRPRDEELLDLLMPYGVREYAARDSEGGLWSFMQGLPTSG